MAITKKSVEGNQPAEVPETRECKCGDNADVWDGRCRRCGLSG